MNTQDLAQDDVEIKPRRKPSTPQPDLWYKRYPDVYRRGTRKLSLAARGAYSDILDMIYMAGGPIEDDDFAIACELRVKKRVWLRVRQELFAAGKLVSANGRISNPKAVEVLAEREARKVSKGARELHASDTKSLKNNVGQKKLLQGKFNVINGGKPTEVEVEVEAELDGVCGEVESHTSVAAVAGAPQPEVGHKDLLALLLEAGGDAIANPAAAPGLLNLSFPTLWLDEGCDLHRDILPTVRELAARPRKSRIIAWRYFHHAVAEAKATRQEGLPTANRSAPKVGGGARAQHMRELAECRALLAK